MKKNKFTNRTTFVRKIMTCTIALVLGVSAGILSYSKALYTPDEYVTNYIYAYNPFSKADDRITLVSIDSDTIEEYGDYSDWDRNLLSEAVSIISDNSAATIALDVDLSGNKTTDGDAALVSACESAGNVVAIADASFDTPEDKESHNTPNNKSDSSEQPDSAKSDDKNNQNTDNNMKLAKPADSSLDWSKHSTTDITYPYGALCKVVTVGISNAMQQSHDGSIHSAALTVNYGDSKLDSFASVVYSTYQKSQGLSTE